MDIDDADDFFAAGPSSPRAPGGAADPLAANEYDRLAQRYSDAGYREGITSGKLLNLQEGFDEGFAASVPLSRRLGRLRGRAAALLAYHTSKGKGRADQDGSAGGQATINSLRDLISALGRVRRDDMLPRDEEAEAHEREHGDLPPPREGSGRELESLEMGLERMGQSGQERRQSGEDVLASLEDRLRLLEQEFSSQYPTS